MPPPTEAIFKTIDQKDTSDLEAILEQDPGLVHARHPNPDLYHWTTLQYAAAKGNLAACRLLVDYGAEVYTNPMNTYPPVLQAKWMKHQEVVDYFLTEIPDKADGTHKLGITLNLAAREGWTDLVRRHLEADPLAVHQRGWIGDTCLHWPSHTVLWTKQSFSGDLKIEYEYTRTDEADQFVTILYIQATGSDEEGFPKDISEWADKRSVPAMKTYFNNMNSYHISYAAYGGDAVEDDFDYIRARRDMPLLKKGLTNTELDPDVFQRTGLFAPGVPHHITIIKKGNELFMMIKNPDKEYLCHWVNDKHPGITEGRIGLRHMFTRSARYKNFQVSTLRSF
ncbi:MAG: DUF1961 family protein [Verrucomicrobia bacterium]|nr:DUF1961 family protein [Verrucomicrobiota bacterium]MDA1065971.1 DUF1961 family protein [Verrucomicrobiota bacterium]